MFLIPLFILEALIGGLYYINSDKLTNSILNLAEKFIHLLKFLFFFEEILDNSNFFVLSKSKKYILKTEIKIKSLLKITTMFLESH